MHRLTLRITKSWSWLSRFRTVSYYALAKATGLADCGARRRLCVPSVFLRGSFEYMNWGFGEVGCQMRWRWWLKRLRLRECFLAEVQHRRYHVFDHGTLDRLPSVCDEIGLLLYFAFNFTFAYSVSSLFYKLCCILLSLYKQVKLLSFWTKFEAVVCCFFALCSKLRAE